MSLNRFAKRRDVNEPDIVAALRKVGAVSWPLDTPCDRLVGFRGRWVTLEIKDGRKPPSARALTPAEVEFMAQCDYYHLPHYVVTSIAEALAAIGASEAQA